MNQTAFYYVRFSPAESSHPQASRAAQNNIKWQNTKALKKIPFPEAAKLKIPLDYLKDLSFIFGVIPVQNWIKGWITYNSLLVSCK